jgi:hypothetical protein
MINRGAGRDEEPGHDHQHDQHELILDFSRLDFPRERTHTPQLPADGYKATRAFDVQFREK